MGQFQSKEYDGDPYVDLMRALPERELIWWVQKAIWVSHAWLQLDWSSSSSSDSSSSTRPVDLVHVLGLDHTNIAPNHVTAVSC